MYDLDILSDSTWRLLFCLYGAPILMMLFLPRRIGMPQVKSEIFLDLFQVAIVVALVYSTFFFLPSQPDAASPSASSAISASVMRKVCSFSSQAWCACNLRQPQPRKICCSVSPSSCSSVRWQPSSATGSISITMPSAAAGSSLAWTLPYAAPAAYRYHLDSGP